MLDVMSGGRLIAGLVVGGGPEYYSTNVNPTDARPRFREAVDLVIAGLDPARALRLRRRVLPIALRESLAPSPPAAPPAGVDPGARFAEHHHLLRRARVRLHGGGLLRATRDLRPPGRGLPRRRRRVGTDVRPRAAGLAHHGLRGRDRRAGRRGSRRPSRLLPGDPGGGIRGAGQGVDAAGVHRPARPRAVPGRSPGHGRGPPTHRCRRRGVEAIAADRQPGHGSRAVGHLRERARVSARSWRCCNSGRSPPTSRRVRPISTPPRSCPMSASTPPSTSPPRGGRDRRRRARRPPMRIHVVGVGARRHGPAWRHRPTRCCTSTGCATSTPCGRASSGPRSWPAWPTSFDVVAPALPGYNASGGLEDFDDVEDYVWHLVDLCHAAGLGAIDVVGHSLGRMVRRRARLAKTGRGPTPGAGRSPRRPCARRRGAPVLRGRGAPGHRRGGRSQTPSLRRAPEGTVAHDALPDVMTTEQQLLWFGGLAGAARLGWKAPHFQSRKLTERLGRVEVPTLVIRGERDRLVLRRGGRVWEGSVPRGATPRDTRRRPLPSPRAARDRRRGGRLPRRTGLNRIEETERELEAESVELAGTSAVVTGGASGIGAATVELLRAAGARVAVLDVQQGSGPAELYLRCDIAVEEEVVAAVGQVHDALGWSRRGRAQCRRRWFRVLGRPVERASGTGSSASTCGGRSCACARWARPWWPGAGAAPSWR